MRLLFIALCLWYAALAHADAKPCGGTKVRPSQLQGAGIACPDGLCQFFLPGGSFTRVEEAPGVARFVSDTGASLSYSRGWIPKNLEQEFDQNLESKSFFCHKSFQPMWVSTKSRSGCKHARLALLALPKMFKRFLICATSETEADAMLAAIELRPLNGDQLPINPFKSQELLPALKPQGKYLNTNDEIEQSVLRTLIKNPNMAVNPFLVITVLSRQGHNEHAMAWYGAQFERGTYPELGIPTLSPFPALKAHERFAELDAYALTMADYWSGYEHASTLIIEPKRGQISNNSAIIFGLHGQGSEPGALKGVAQELANASGALVVLQSAGIRFREARFDWSELVQHDQLRLQYAESLVHKKWPQLQPSKRLLFGFGQGAQVALQIATKYPEQFHGAAAFTPFSAYSEGFVSTIRSERLQGRLFLLQATRSSAPALKEYQARLVAAGAKVETRFEEKRDPKLWKMTSWLVQWVNEALQSN